MFKVLLKFLPIIIHEAIDILKEHFEKRKLKNKKYE